jgi:hypothetical protein
MYVAENVTRRHRFQLEGSIATRWGIRLYPISDHHLGTSVQYNYGAGPERRRPVY